MKKTTIPFMLALLASAHLAQAAHKPFTATITTNVKGGTASPNFFVTPLVIQPSDGNLPATTLNSNGITQVQLVPNKEYVLMGKNITPEKGQPLPMLVGWNGTSAKYVFRADKSKPNIKLDGQTYTDNILRMTVTIS